MEYRELGVSGLKVSVLTLGCWQFSGSGDTNWGSGYDEETAIKTIQAALDLGVNSFDTAEGYGAGNSERVLCKALGDRRKDVILSSKVAETHLSPEDLIKSCNDSLERLGTEYIDYYQIHWPNDKADMKATLEALKTLQEQGKIRHFGVSNHGPQDLKRVMEHKDIIKCQSNQLAYNLLARGIEYEVQPACQEYNLSILCYSPLMHGLLCGKFKNADEVPEGRARTRHFSSDRRLTRHREPGFEKETFQAIEEIGKIAEELNMSMGDLALAWLKYQPSVCTVIVGARTPQQIQENVRGITTQLSPQILARLDDATRPLKEAMGSNIDLWERVSRAK
ncbi:Aldo/keto reductase [Balamuthia mandrillaris]